MIQDTTKGKLLHISFPFTMKNLPELSKELENIVGCKHIDAGTMLGSGIRDMSFFVPEEDAKNIKSKVKIWAKIKEFGKKFSVKIAKP